MRKDLTKLNDPYFHLTFAEKDSIYKYYNSIISNNVVLRIIDGNNCISQEKLFAEFAEALEFPDYFGYNWMAFDECINDLEWLPGDAYLLFITNIKRIKEGNNLNTLLKTLSRSVKEWTEGRNYDDFPTPPTPFHVVFQIKEEYFNKIEKCFKKAKLEYDLITF